MNCPHCDHYTRDLPKCENCGGVLPAPKTTSYSMYAEPEAGSWQNKIQLRPVYFVALALILGAFWLLRSGHAASTAVNRANPGETLEIASYLQAGRINIVDFYSEFCPPCRQMSPLLSKLAKKRSDIQVIKVDINRKGVKGIDWASPLARQFALGSIPHFKVYDKNGDLIAEGQEGTQYVVTALYQAGINLD